MEFEILYSDNTGWLGRYWEPNLKVWVLGVEIQDWSLSNYKRYISIFAQVLNQYPTKYISLVRGKREKKFNMLFGFRETGIILDTDKGKFEVLDVI